MITAAPLRTARASLCFSALLLAPALPAQITFEPNFGAPLGCSAGFDWVVSGLPLGFDFTFPGAPGTVNSIDVTANGRILPGGTLATGDNGDFQPELGKFLNDPFAAIAPFWKDMDFTNALSDNVYFNAFPGRAVITWNDAIQFSGTTTFTFQVQLFDDGRIQYIYDVDIESSLARAIVGLSPGMGALAPAETDFSSLSLVTLSSGSNPMVYEDFNLFTNPADIIDLQTFSFEFTPNSNGGWTIDGPTRGATEEVGFACEKSITFTPDGTGGYVITDCGTCFEAAPGADLGLIDESISPSLPLGFNFAFPGGRRESAVQVTDNGRITPAGALTGTDRMPSPFDLLSPTHPTIAPLWSNFDPSSAGSVEFISASAGAVFTWRDVVQFGETEPITFQAILRNDDSFTFVYRSTERFVEVVTTALVGITEGAALATAPPEADFTNLPIFLGGSSLYEWIDTTASGGETWTYQPRLAARTNPAFGSALDLQLEGVQQSTTQAVIVFGAANPMLDLGQFPALGLPGCVLYSTGDIGSVPVPFANGVSSVLSLPVATTSQIGLTLHLQGAMLSPGATPLGVALTNGLRVIVGP